MPAQRGTARHCDEIDDHGAAYAELVEAVLVAIEDHETDEVEEARIRAAIRRGYQTFAPLPRRASQMDNVSRLAGALIQTMEITPWTERIGHEAAADRIAA
jgi:hypothetical protein